MLTKVFQVDISKSQLIEGGTLAVVDYDKSLPTKMLLDNLKQKGAFSEYIKLKTLMEKQDINEKDILGVITIPKGFAKGIYYCKNPNIKIKLKEHNSLQSELIKSVLKSYTSYISIVESSVTGAVDNIKELPISIEEKDSFNENLSIKLITTVLNKHTKFEKIPHNNIPITTAGEYYALALMLVFTMYMASMLGSGIIDEKNRDVIKRTICLDVKLWKFIMSKSIVFFSLSYIYSIIFIISMYSINGIYLGNAIGRICTFLIVSHIFISSLFMFLGCIFKNKNSYIIFSNLLILLISVIGGCFIPIYMLPGMVQKLSFFTPSYQILKAYAFLVNGYDLKDIRAIIVTLLILSITFWVSGIYKASKSQRG